MGDPRLHKVAGGWPYAANLMMLDLLNPSAIVFGLLIHFLPD